MMNLESKSVTQPTQSHALCEINFYLRNQWHSHNVLEGGSSNRDSKIDFSHLLKNGLVLEWLWARHDLWFSLQDSVKTHKCTFLNNQTRCSMWEPGLEGTLDYMRHLVLSKATDWRGIVINTVSVGLLPILQVPRLMNITVLRHPINLQKPILPAKELRLRSSTENSQGVWPDPPQLCLLASRAGAFPCFHTATQKSWSVSSALGGPLPPSWADLCPLQPLILYIS